MHYFEYEHKTISVGALLDIWDESQRLAVELLKFGHPIGAQFLMNDADNSGGK